MKRIAFLHSPPITALYILVLTLLFLPGCSEKTQVVSENEAPYYNGISKIRVENYVNRMYIDLIGREPLPDERQSDVDFLRSNNLEIDAREQLLLRLQTDTTWVDGDTSYAYAYYRRFYDLAKARLLESVDDVDLQREVNQQAFAAELDSLNGDSADMYRHLALQALFENVITSRSEYREGTITTNQVFERMLSCPVYDDINMNTFNLINAAFNDLYFRYPTQVEFDVAFDMIEYNQSGILFFESGQNFGDFASIMTNSREYSEGMIWWAFVTLLAREPATSEVDLLLPQFLADNDFQRIQRFVMRSDEYANF